MTKVLFICMGNICRSPTAEAVFAHAVRQAGLEGALVCASAGTHGYHVGASPDARAQEAATRRGYHMGHICARQVIRKDFELFDYVVAMDHQNLAALREICPPEYAHKLSLYCDTHEQFAGLDVPDPYYGGPQGFEQVLDMVEAVTANLIERLRKLDRA